ncbi:MAG: site-specific integrase [Bacteroidales bacterium]|nr:site-specific integrase [Bacteroidales bacterium]
MDNLNVLQYAVENGIIDTDSVLAEINMNERRRFLEQHKNKVWQTDDGKEWKTYLPDEKANRGKRIIRRTTKSALEDALVEFYKEQELDPNFEDVFNLWIDRKLRYEEIQKQTYDRYKTDFYRFFEGTSMIDRRFRYITQEELEEFIRDTILEKKLSAKGWANLRLLLNGMFRYGKKFGFTNISITQFMGDLDLSRKSFRKIHRTDEESVFTDEEVRRISYELDNDNILDCAIRLAFLTGMRAGEISALAWEDVKDGYIDVCKTEVRYRNDDGHYEFVIQNNPKTDAGFRKLVLTDEAQEFLAELHSKYPNNEYVFMKNGSRIRSKLFSTRLYRICDHLNIARRSMHKARKTYATRLLVNNVPENVIISQMGHTDISTTKNYYFYNNKKQEEIRNYLNEALRV